MNPQQERYNIAPEERNAKITLRSIIIGLVLMPPSAYWLALVEIKEELSVQLMHRSLSMLSLYSSF